MEGTITWFEFDKVKPTTTKGLWVLCYYGPNAPVDSNYYWASTNTFTSGKIPTHWAYINLPKEV